MIKGSVGQRTWSRSFQPKLYSIPYTCNARQDKTIDTTGVTWQHLPNRRWWWWYCMVLSLAKVYLNLPLEWVY